MCGRLTLHRPFRQLMLAFEVGPSALSEIPPRYNIAPSQAVLAIREENQERKVVLLKWGLVPSWAKDPDIGQHTVNARSESLAEKPAFQSAFRHRRCLIPADGFYEWQGQGKRKVPFYFHRRDGAPMALAGLWEHWQDEAGNELETCTVVTTASNGLVRPFHERMPAILEKKDWAAWLAADTPLEQVSELLHPAAEEMLTAYAVSQAVNSPGHEGEGCIQPAARIEPEGGFFRTDTRRDC